MECRKSPPATANWIRKEERQMGTKVAWGRLALLALLVTSTVIGATVPARHTLAAEDGFIGLGLVLESNLSGEGYVKINRVLKQAGDDVKASVEPGDLISHMDGKSVKGLTVDEVVALVRGPDGTAAGSTLKLTLQRAGKAKEVTLKRKVFKPAS